MRRVAEIIYIVPEKRERFLAEALNPDYETQKVLWLCGVRKQQYFQMNELIFMTFEYSGNAFEEDMKKMALYLDNNGKLVQKRRKDVPIEERSTTDWWAPVKRLGTLLEKSPIEDEDRVYGLMDILDGSMSEDDSYQDISYDEEEWLDEFHF